MKRNNVVLILFVAVCILLHISLSEQGYASGVNVIPIPDPNQTPVSLSTDNIPHPRIVFEARELDFGKIGPRTQPSGEFRFTNKGNALLEIISVKQCCGIKIDYDKSKYEPGESGVIKATYSAASQAGSLIRHPIVNSNDPIEPNLILTVKAQIVEKIASDPERIKLFLDEENGGCPKLTISSTDGEPFSIKSVTSTGNCISGLFDPNEKANKFELDLKVNMEALPENKTGNISIALTHPESSLFTIPFNVISKFTLNPPLIIVLNAEPEVPVIRKIWVFNNYNKDFEIASASSKEHYFKVLSQSKIEETDMGYQFEVEITPPSRSSDSQSKFNDEFYIQIKDGEKLVIECNGYYKPDNLSTATDD